MGKAKRDLIEVKCPCCDAMLQIDTELRVAISHKEKVRPPAIEDLQAAVKKLKGEESRRAELFDKSFAQHKTNQQVLERKFDELLRQAKDSPGGPPPKRPFDLD